MATRLKVWNPIIDDNLMGCCFDVTPSDIQLGAGTLELMKKFLKELKIEAQPEDWYIKPFCSVYYSSTIAESYQDRHPIAWRVKISFAEPCSEDAKLGLCLFEPIGVDAVDHTWEEDDNSWNWKSMNYVAIADFNPWDWNKLLENDFYREPVFLQYWITESNYLGHYVQQVRFDLGMTNFPEDEERVMNFSQICENYNASVNWAKTMHGWY